MNAIKIKTVFIIRQHLVPSVSYDLDFDLQQRTIPIIGHTIKVITNPKMRQKQIITNKLG